ncbi:hypothetical protein EDC94DRAFT_612439 [Helicostylum pulchrum]|nr:hypothetical protein EDC94DRAFT_612439 [Helicostylum pulchrum]
MSSTVLRISSYFYLLCTLLLPQQTIMVTSQFLSLITTLPKDPNYIVAMIHASKCFLLLLRFIVLFTILSGKELYTLTATATTKKHDSRAKTKKPALTPIMQPNATLTLESTTQNGTEPITVSPVSSKMEPAKLQKQTISSSNNNNVAVAQHQMQNVPVIDRQKTPPVSSSTNVKLDDKKEPRPPILSDVPTMSPDQPIKQEIDLAKPSSSVVVAVAESPVPSDKEPNTGTAAIVLNNKKEQLAEVLDLSVTDSIPSLKSDDSSSFKQSSDVSKEPYYVESIKKDSNLMSSPLPDNTQQLFDELTATSTPIPSDNSAPPPPPRGRFYSHERTSSSTQPSIEETVPGLSPHPSTSVSRKSSMASQRSGLKDVFKSTISKMSRKNSVRELHPPLQQQQQQQQQQAAADDVGAAAGAKKRSISVRVKNKLKNIVHRKSS